MDGDVEPEASDLETIDLSGGVPPPRTVPRFFANRQVFVAIATLLAVLAIGGLSLAVWSRHDRQHPAERIAARPVPPTATTTTTTTQPHFPDEPILGRYYPIVDDTDTTTIVFPSGLTVRLSGGVRTAIGGLGATFFGTAAPKRAADCCPLSFFFEHAAPSDLFTSLPSKPISIPVLVPSTRSILPDLRQVVGRFGVLSTGDWTLIASFENGDHTPAADAVVRRILRSWRLRSTPNGPVIALPGNSAFEDLEVDFGRTPDLTDREVNLSPNCATAKRAIAGTATRTNAYWCEHNIRVNVDGPRAYVEHVVAHLEIQPLDPLTRIGPFTGTWYAHGIRVTIDTQGNGSGAWRTYRDCTTDRPPCDTFSGNVIFDGGADGFSLRRTGPSTAAGTVLRTTQPSVLPLGPLRAHLDTARDFLYLTPARSSDGSLRLCGPNAKTLTCG